MCGENDGIHRERSKNLLVTPEFYVLSPHTACGKKKKIVEMDSWGVPDKSQYKSAVRIPVMYGHPEYDWVWYEIQDAIRL